MSKVLTLEHFDSVMGAIKQSFDSVETRMGAIEANMATKADLTGLATKDQVKTLATKTELATLRAKIKFDTEDSVHKAAQTLRSDFSELQTSVDKCTKRTEDWHREQFSLRNCADRLEKTLIRKHVISDEDLTSTAI